MAAEMKAGTGGTSVTGTGRGSRAPVLPPGVLLVVLLLMVLEAGVVALTTRYLVQRPAAVAAGAPGDVEYVDLGEIYATLPTDAGGQASRYFRVQVSVGVSRDNRVEVRDRIDRLRPRIQDEIQSILLKESYPQVRLPESKKRIATTILAALTGILGPGSVQEVVLPKYEPQ